MPNITTYHAITYTNWWKKTKEFWKNRRFVGFYCISLVCKKKKQTKKKPKLKQMAFLRQEYGKYKDC